MLSRVGSRRRRGSIYKYKQSGALARRGNVHVTVFFLQVRLLMYNASKVIKEKQRSEVIRDSCIVPFFVQCHVKLYIPVLLAPRILALHKRLAELVMSHEKVCERVDDMAPIAMLSICSRVSEFSRFICVIRVFQLFHVLRAQPTQESKDSLLWARRNHNRHHMGDA